MARADQQLAEPAGPAVARQVVEEVGEVGGQVRIGRHQFLGDGSGRADDVFVPQQGKHLQLGPPAGLGRSENVAFTAEFQVQPGQFEAVQKKLTAIPCPEFGTMTAREFFLYRSQLSSHGSRYSKIAQFPLAER